MKRYVVNGSLLSGSLAAPPSKSHTLRAILLASLAEGTSHIHNYLLSPDTDAMIRACQLLGAVIQRTDKRLRIQGVAGKPCQPEDVIDAGNSGQVLRFVGAVAGLMPGYTVMTGDHSIRTNRPVTPLIQGLEALGAQCVAMKDGEHAPLIIKGPISPGCAHLDGTDSQPVSGLLIAAAFLNGTTELHISHPGETPWLALTLDWLDRLGIRTTRSADFSHCTVTGGPCPTGFDYVVPGDFSSIAYPVVAALITQSSVLITGLDPQDSQGDKQLIDVLCAMGANLYFEDTTLIVQPSGSLMGHAIDVNGMIDALPILAVLGCYAEGTTRLFNAGIARYKESNRLIAIANGLRRMGACIDVSNDELAVRGGHSLNATDVSSCNDHRIALSLVVAAMGISTGTSVVNNVACVAKSYPGFIDAMQSLGGSMREEEASP